MRNYLTRAGWREDLDKTLDDFSAVTESLQNPALLNHVGSNMMILAGIMAVGHIQQTHNWHAALNWAGYLVLGYSLMTRSWRDGNPNHPRKEPEEEILAKLGTQTIWEHPPDFSKYYLRPSAK